MRQIIKIDENKCNGCGNCIPNCHEGALQMIDGKARLISDLRCDGLGACIGECPVGAISLEEREAAPYDEIAVIKEMIKKGKNTVIAHFNHLKQHGEDAYINQGFAYLWEHEDELDFSMNEVSEQVHGPVKNKPKQEGDLAETLKCGCPGTAAKEFKNNDPKAIHKVPTGGQVSQLTHWPVQLHLVNPSASYFKHTDLLLSADCVAYSLGDFHANYLKGKALSIACPKLDSNKEVYLQKLISMIDDANINTITVMKMEVPCCGGILELAKQAVNHASRKVPVKSITVSVQGEIIDDEWV
jgi:NAD-dependent dihydropyrimidine dehydrogenase PreA subunit